MSGPSIIVDPQKMFSTLHELQIQTAGIIVQMHDFAGQLQKVANFTYAIGFGELVKNAEKEVNEVGHGMVAATNAINTACKEVVNQLVDKFASEGAKSDYSPPKFTDVHIKINPADRAAIDPAKMDSNFLEMDNKILVFNRTTWYFERIYLNTKTFWRGVSADRTRENFRSKVLPSIDEFHRVMKTIIELGRDWLYDAVHFEASLGVQ